MWKRIKDNLDAGTEKVKWFSSLLNDRLKIEISLMRLLYQSSEMEKKRAELRKTVGERVCELRNGPEKNVLRDPVIMETLKDLDALEAELEDVKRKASEISGLEA